MTQDSKKDVFTVNWSIENFSMCPQKRGEHITSPTFVVDVWGKTRWELRLYPKGILDSPGEYVSCHLYMTSNKMERKTLCYNLTLLTVDMQSFVMNNYQESFIMKEKSYFTYNDIVSLTTLFGNRSTFLPNDVLTIQCSMWTMTDENESPAEPKETMITPATPLGTAVSLEEISSVVSDEGSEITSVISEHFPTQCSFCTRIPIERRQITWTFKDFIAKIQSTRKISVSVVSALREKSALLLSCYVSGDWYSDGTVRIDIQRMDRDFKQTLVRCKVSVLDRSGVAQGSKEDEHLFGEDYEVWSFPPVIKLSTLEYRKYDLLNGDQLSLRCEFLISYEGEEVTMGGANLQPHHPMEEDTLNCDTDELLHVQNFADVTLISEDFEFSAHKSVLCARSRVFRAMFSEDTQENRTGVVRITDIDAETLRNMRNFLYDSALDLQPDDVFKLYSAADKYEILTLKEQCATILKYNLSISNLCDVLMLADKHQDYDLMKYVEDFLCVHVKDVFKSPEFKELMKKNTHLSRETMLMVFRTICQRV